MNRLPITVVVLTRDEERNLARCLDSVCGWTRRQIVVDSGSADRTREIARDLDADVFEHPFKTHAHQWKWALDSIPIDTDWVLGLDADQRVTEELARELRVLFTVGVFPKVAGLYVRRRQIFRGRWIRHGGYYPKYLLKLFRRDRVRIDEEDLVDHHFHVDGPVRLLRNDIIEANTNEDDINVWIAKHNRYAALQAREHLRRHERAATRSARLLGTPDERVLWWKRAWDRLPLFVRPGMLFSYRYFLRMGFLDGREGFLFHFLQSFWYRLVVDAKIEELRTASEQPLAVQADLDDAPVAFGSDSRTRSLRGEPRSVATAGTKAHDAGRRGADGAAPSRRARSDPSGG